MLEPDPSGHLRGTPPVGLSAYAAAAISREDPIKTGVQGFKYDIRTAILPFMFEKTGSDCITGLHDRMVTNRSRLEKQQQKVQLPHKGQEHQEVQQHY